MIIYNPDLQHTMMQPQWDVIRQTLTKAIEWLKNIFAGANLEEAFEELKRGYAEGTPTPQLPADAKFTPVEVEMLTKSSLVDIAKKNIVVGSNQVAVMKSETDKAYFVYLAYLNGDELMPNNENNFVVVKAEALSKEVISLFADKELRILN